MYIVSIRGNALTEEIDHITRIMTYRGLRGHGYLVYNSNTREAHFTKDVTELQQGPEHGYDVLLGHRLAFHY